MDYTILFTALKVAYENLYVYVGIFALLLLLLLIRGTKEERHLFVFPVLFLALTLYNPLLINPIMDDIGLLPRIRRIYWLLPVNVLLAYMAVKAVYLFQKKALRTVVAILVCVCIVLGGSPMINTAMDKTENPYKIPDEIIEIADSLKRDENNEVQTAYVDPDLLALREYDPAIKNALNRKLMWTWKVDITDESKVQQILTGDNPNKIIALVLRFGYTAFDAQIFRNALMKSHTDYLIARSDGEQNYLLEFCGCRPEKRVGDFTIYKTRIDEIRDIADYYKDATFVMLTRHGQTEGNKQGLFMGGTLDSPLTSEAEYQSRALGENLYAASGHSISAAYSSELGRAYFTAQNILEGMDEADLPITKLSGLNDICWGDIEGKTKKEVKELYGSTDLPVFMGTYDQPDFESPAHGENLYQFYQRFDAAMEEIGADENNRAKTVLVVAHSSAAEWAKIKFKKDLDGLYHNGVSVLRYKDGDWTIISWNDMSFQ